MKKWFLLLAACLLVCPFAHAAQQSAFPVLLQFSQKSIDREYLRNDVYIARTYPVTANQAVNKQLRVLINRMTVSARPYLSTKRTNLMPSYLDVGSTVLRTGTQWMSFLTIARIAREREQTYVDFDARVYDMKTGARITLCDVFAPDSAAWSMLERAVRAQLTAYFPAETPDAALLDALCARSSLEGSAFTLSAGRLTLHFRADALYPGKHTLMHVMLYYSQIRPYMTRQAFRQTDNSSYKMVALTFDDGPARGSTAAVTDILRNSGAAATFFVTGSSFAANHDTLCRTHDAGYDIQNHTYEHVYSGLTKEYITKYQRLFNSELSAVTGHTPTCMRAPGGDYKQYIKAGVGMPLIQWSVMPGDAGAKDINGIANRVNGHVKDGSVVLMHDLNPLCCKYLRIIMDTLEQRGYLCVTVDELFDHYGVSLQPDTLYYGCEDAAKRMKK